MRASPSKRSLLIALLLALTACSDRRSLVLSLTHPAGKDLATSAAGGRVILAIVDGHTRQILKEREIDAADLREGRLQLFSDVPLVEGRVYQIFVKAHAVDLCPSPASGVLSGSSPAFVFGDAITELSIYVDCEDGVSNTGSLIEPRIYHTATFLPSPLPHGRVMVTGGVQLTSLKDLVNLANVKIHQTIEVYEPSSGRFRRLAARLTRPRFWHQATAVGEDDLLITGGVDTVKGIGKPQLTLTAEVDRLRRERISTLAPMSEARGLHAALRVGTNLLIAGGSVAGNVAPRSAELYDPIAGKAAGALPKMKSPHVLPAAVAVGAGALIAGGFWLPKLQPVADRFCGAGSCGLGAAGFVGLASFPKGEGRTNLTATYVPCVRNQPGAVYLVGGWHDEGKLAGVPRKVYSDIYCVDAEKLDTLKLVGHLLNPRYQHTTSLVRGPNETARLFVAGGNVEDGSLSMEAELVTVKCQCKAISAQDIKVVPMSTQLAGHTATNLADGSVLLVGGVFNAAGALRFNPAY